MKSKDTWVRVPAGEAVLHTIRKGTELHLVRGVYVLPMARFIEACFTRAEEDFDCVTGWEWWNDQVEWLDAWRQGDGL